MRTTLGMAAIVCVSLLFGCATTTPSNSSWLNPAWLRPAWIADYEEAERAAMEAGTGILFLFTNKDLTRTDLVREYLSDPANRGQARDYIPALLFREYEADRRYAAQFGVNRAPAVIVVHRDGTYHATQVGTATESLNVFLSGASPPGAVPKLNPTIHRRAGYAWYRDWNSARAAADQAGKPIFVVLERWMSRDWETLSPMLQRREVISRVSTMIHCRPSTLWSSSAQVASELGIENLPAIAIVMPDSPHRVLELPTSYESIARFAAEAVEK